MQISFICPVVPGRFKDFWEPKIEAIRRDSKELFPSRHVLQGGTEPNRYATGVADVDSDQLAAIQADPDILIIDDGSKVIKTLSTDDKTKLANAFAFLGLTQPSPGETIDSVIAQTSTRIANKEWPILIEELNKDIATKSIIITPGMVTTIATGKMLHKQKLYRRQLIKLAALGGAAWMIRPCPARASVVFTDSFTVASDTTIDVYPSNPSAYPNWHDTVEGDHLYVNDANDRVQMTLSGGASAGGAYIDAAGIPTGNQKITAGVFSQTTDGYAGLLTRVAVGSIDYYLAFYDADGSVLEIYRVDTGSFNLLTSQSRAITYPATGSFKADGTGATIDLTATGTGVADVTQSDSDVTFRKTTGAPGIRIYETVSDTAYIDDVSVDDLAVVGSTTLFGHARIYQ